LICDRHRERETCFGHHDGLDVALRCITPKADIVKSIKLDLTGARLRQDIARGDRCTSGSQEDRRTDQAKQKYPRQQRTKADNTPFPVEQMVRAPETLCRQPTLLRAVRRHYQSPDRKEVRMFTDISIGKILNPIGLALSYQAAADAWSNWGIIGPVCRAVYPVCSENLIRVDVFSDGGTALSRLPTKGNAGARNGHNV
jgi:hypothetical protein